MKKEGPDPVVNDLPVSLEVAKIHLRVTNSKEDEYITNLIISANAYLMRILWRDFCDQYPADYRHLVLLRLSSMYENRGDQGTPLSPSEAALINVLKRRDIL